MKQKIERPETPIARVQAIVAGYFGLTVEAMLESKRTTNLVFARQMAMALCRDVLGVNSNQIAQAFRMKDHGTALYSCRKISEARQQKPALAAIFAALAEKIVAAEKARIAE